MWQHDLCLWLLVTDDSHDFFTDHVFVIITPTWYHPTFSKMFEDCNFLNLVEVVNIDLNQTSRDDSIISLISSISIQIIHWLLFEPPQFTQ
jgi:hypothetical protein